MENTGLCVPKSAQELLLEFRVTGRQEPFEEIVRRYAGMVYHVCMQVTKNAHDAEDATQAVFLTLAVQAKTAKEIRSLGPWLQQVAKRLSLDLRKSRKRREKREERHGMMASRNGNGNGNGNGHNSGGLVPLQREELRSVLDEELHNLPAKYRLPLVLHYFGGMSREAMAEELQCKPGTLGARLHRGRAMLGTRLAERGVTLRDGVLASALAVSVHAAVTDMMVVKTSEAAMHLAAGRELGVGLISANVVGMVRRAIHMALYAKLKAVGVGLLVLGTVMAAGAEVVTRTRALDLRWTSPTELGNRLWPLFKPIFTPSYSDATPASNNSGAMQLADADARQGGQWGGLALGTPKADAVLGSLNRPEWNGPMLSDLSNGVTPYLFPSRPVSSTVLAGVGAVAGEVESRSIIPTIAKPRPAELPATPSMQAGTAPMRFTSVPPPSVRGSLAAMTANVPPVPIKVQEFKPLAPAIETGSRSMGPWPEPGASSIVDRVPIRPIENSTNVKVAPPEAPPPPQNSAGFSAWADPTTLVSRERGRDVSLVSTYKAPVGNQTEMPTNTAGGSAGSGTNIISGIAPDNANTTASVNVKSAPTYDSTASVAHIATSYSMADSFSVDFGASSIYVPVSGQTWTGLKLAPDSANSATFYTVTQTPKATPPTPVEGYAGLPNIRLQGVRVGPQDILRGYGTVLDTNTFNQNSKVIADGLGSPQTLDLSQVHQIVSTLTPTGITTNGWFAQNQGRLTLPPISVNSGSGTYNWGETLTDQRLDLINSVQLGFANVTNPGRVQVDLLSLDRPDVPTLPSGHHFVGLWQFNGTGMSYDKLSLTVRYDQTMVARLGLDESYLKLWRFDGTNWEVVHDSFLLDRTHKLISGKTNGLSYFAVSTPEPGGALLIGLAAWFMGRRRRRA